MGKPSKFEKLRRRAVKRGWVVPCNSVFSQETWVAYWEAMARYEAGESEGRPIPPHRPGGGRRIGLLHSYG